MRASITFALLAMTVAAGSGAASVVTRPVSLRYLQMVDAESGYALAGGGDTYRVLRTHDGGRLWTDVTPGRGTYRATGPLTIRGSLVLFATRVRGGAFATEKSIDGGRSWRQSLPFRDAYGAPAPASPRVIDAQHLYLAVNEGAAAGSSSQSLFSSSDGAKSWEFVSRTGSSNPAPGQLPFGCDKSGFGFATVSRGFAGGYCAGGAPFFYRTDDGGHTWQRAPLAAPRGCACETTAPTFFSSRVGALAVYGFAENGSGSPLTRIFWTSDAGRHWRGSSPAVGRTMPPVITTVRVVWLFGQPPGNLRAPFNRLWRTTDAGSHWISTRLAFDGQDYQLDPLDRVTAFALRDTLATSTILLTNDGGKTWRTIRTYVAR